MSIVETHTTSGRPFNTPLECGLRMLFVLNAAGERRSDLQRLVSYDYLLVHSGDVDDGPESLHPPVPFRGTEVLVKRGLISAGLNQMFSRDDLLPWNVLDLRLVCSLTEETDDEEIEVFPSLDQVKDILPVLVDIFDSRPE